MADPTVGSTWADMLEHITVHVQCSVIQSVPPPMFVQDMTWWHRKHQKSKIVVDSDSVVVSCPEVTTGGGRREQRKSKSKPVSLPALSF